MASVRVEDILDQVNMRGAWLPDLLRMYHPRGESNKSYEPLWSDDPEGRLYRTFARKLIGAGHPTRAYELVREAIALAPFATDQELRYRLAHALARGGNVWKSRQHVRELLQDPDLTPHWQCEALALEARLYKDEYERATD